MRLRPYRTADNKIDGALVIFIDIPSALKTTQTAVQELNNFSTAVMESAATLVMATDRARPHHPLQPRLPARSVATRSKRSKENSSGITADTADEVESVNGHLQEGAGGGSRWNTKNHWVTRSGRQRLIALEHRGFSGPRRLWAACGSNRQGYHGPAIG